MKLSKREILKISLLMFSMFFGAGNLMFPTMLGKEVGTNIVYAMIYFAITAIVFPILAVMVVSRFGGLKYLGNRVDKYFGMAFTIASLSIGPALAIPRAGVLPYEIGIAPRVGGNSWLWVYTTIFFLIVTWFCLTPHKLLDRVSKFLSPLFLFLIVLLFFGGLFRGILGYGAPVDRYVPLKGIQAFLDGYLTLDIIAGLMYGLAITNVVRDRIRAAQKENGENAERENTTEDNKSVDKNMKIVGLIAGTFLFIVYFVLAHIGAVSVNLFDDTKSGLDILRNMSEYLYGGLGLWILVALFFIACLNISVGIMTSMAQYFVQLFPKTKYNFWIIIWVIVSYLVSNLGFEEIMQITIPVLLTIYPMAVMLIIMGLLDKYIYKYKFVYPITIYSIFFVSIVGIFDKYGINIPVFTNLFAKLPMYSLDLGWLSVAIVVMLLVIIVNKIAVKNK